MQADHSPNPKRFQVFVELPNKKGFRIKDSKYVYMFDKFGGWYDEYNNYYNPDGQHQDPPSDEDDDFEKTVFENDLDQDDDDYYENEYGGNLNTHQDDYQDDIYHQSNQHTKTIESIAHNQLNLSEYPLKTALRVDFDDMSEKVTKQQALKYYKSKIGKGIINVILIKPDGKFLGQGYIVCDDVTTALKLVQLQNQQLLGSKIHYEVETVQQFLADPLTNEQKNIAINEDDFQSLVKVQPKIEESKQQSKNPKKKYYTKQQLEKLKKEEKKGLVPVEQPTVQKVKVEEKIQPTWSKYKSEVTMFPKRDSFIQWMTKLGYVEGEHYKRPMKIQTNDQTKKFAHIELRSDVYQKIEGTSYETQKVHFEIVN